MAFQLIYPRRNDALRTNPPAGDAHITTHASDWLWAVFALMLLFWFVSLGWAYSSRRYNRILHFIPLIVLAVSTVTYFAMASDLGWTLVRSEFDTHPTRQIFFVRYIQWFINAPLVLLVPLSFTSMATPELLVPLFFSWFLVINGLVGALVPTSYKWGFFVFGLFGLFFIWGHLFSHIGRGSFRHADFRGGYIFAAAYISFFWMLYPICWGLSEGSNTISPTSEMVFYGILDLLSGPVFLFTFMGHLSGFDTQILAVTGLGNAQRGMYEERQQQPQQQKVPQPQQGEVAPAATVPNA